MLFVCIILGILLLVILYYWIQIRDRSSKILSAAAIAIILGITAFVYIDNSKKNTGVDERYSSENYLHLRLTYKAMTNLNMRDSPSTQANVIFVLAKGERIIVNRPFLNKGKWVYAETLDGKRGGYVFSDYIRTVGYREEIDQKGGYFWEFWGKL
jgi:uncharacterized protein YgiM (DUF1202 family)